MSTPLSLQNKWSRLYQRHTQGKLSPDDRLNLLIQTGLDAFEMEFAFISHVSEAVYTILYSTNPTWICLQYPLAETYCDITLKRNEIVAIEHISNSFYASHPAHKRFALESYFATPISFNGVVFGTLGFASGQPSQLKLGDFEFHMLRNLAKKAASSLVVEMS